jgi:hypothetical protein
MLTKEELINATLSAIVEVKHRVYKFANTEEDLNRVCETLKRKPDDSSIKCGLIAFYMNTVYKNNTEKKILKQIENFFEQTKNIVFQNGPRVEKHHEIICENEQDVYASVVFAVRR